MPFTLKTKRKKRLPIKRNARKVKEYKSLKDVLKNLDIKKYSYMYNNECLVGNDKSVRKNSENVRKSYSEKEMPTDDEKKLALAVSNKGRNMSCKCLKKNSKLFKTAPNQQQQQHQKQRQLQFQQQQLPLQQQQRQHLRPKKHPSVKYLFPVYPEFSVEGLYFDREYVFQDSTSSDVANEYPNTCAGSANPYNERSNTYTKYASPCNEFSNAYTEYTNPYNERSNAYTEYVNLYKDDSNAYTEYANSYNDDLNAYTKYENPYNKCAGNVDNADNESASADYECKNANNDYANVNNEGENIIFVSLDFLNDCHKQKKKTNRICVQAKKSKYSRKSMGRTSGHRNRFPHKIPKIQRFQKYCEKKKECDKNLTYNKKQDQKTFATRKKSRGTTTAKETDSSFVCLDDPTTFDEPSVVSLDLWPCFQKDTSCPEEDVSKINKKYLQALLMSCRRQQPKREELRQASRTSDKKKKRSAKTNNNKTIKCRCREKNRKSRCDCVVDTDSSETQNPSLGVKNKFLGMKIPQVLTNYDDTPKVKSKKPCPRKRETKCKNKKSFSEVECIDLKKSKKERTNLMKKDDKPCFLEGDVMEIWVRDMGKESETSIASQISSAMAVNEELYNSYNMGMQSYSKLRKLVESEIARISNNSVPEREKNSRKSEERRPSEDKSEKKQKKMPSRSGFFVRIPRESKSPLPKSEGDGERMPDKTKFSRTYANQIVIPITKTFSEMFTGNGEDLDFAVKKRIHQAERQKQITCNQELREAKEKSASHNHFNDGVFENIKSKLKTLGEGKNVNENIPGEIIKNWSILHRLEKAFLALGTPNFQNKKKKDCNMPQTPLKSPNGQNEPESDKLKCRKNKPETCTPESELKRRPSVGDSHKSKISPRASIAVETEKLDQTSRKYKNSSRRVTKMNESPTPLCCASPNYWEENFRKANAHEVLTRKIESCLKRSSTRLKPQCHKHRKDPVNQRADLCLINVREKEESNAKLRKARYPNCYQMSGADFAGMRPPKSKPLRRSDDHDSKPLSEGGKKSKLKFKLITNDVVSPKKFSRLQSRKISKKKVSNCSECDSTHLTNVENMVRPKSIGLLPENPFDQAPPEKSKSNVKPEENSDAFDSKDFLFTPDGKDFLDDLSIDSTEVWKMFDEKETFLLQSFDKKIKSSETIRVDNLEEFVPTLPAKKVSTKKIFASSEKVGKPDSEKENAYSSKGKMAQEKKSEKPIAADVPHKMVRAWKELNNYWYDREIKERSILSIRGNQPTTQVLFKKFNPGKTKPSRNLEADLKPPTPVIKDLHVSVKKNQNQSSGGTQKMSSNTSDSDFVTIKTTPLKDQINVQKESKQNYSIDSSVSVLSSGTCNPVPSEVEAGESEEKKSKAHAQWEQDINCYRTIVKDIMNQYKRTDGFLKHREGLRGPEQDDESLECLTGPDAKSKSNSFVENPEDVDIQEYRKKIVSEYEAVPIFEYKSRKGKETKPEKARAKRKLPVNKVDLEMDLDVKDYQPNVQKVLSSQIYVDVENVSNRKPKEMHSSLQKVFCKNTKEITEQDESLDTYQRTLSLPKAFTPLPPSSNNLGAP